MQATIYHNPRCTKSRQTLSLLEDKGVSPKVIRYLETPPTKSGLKKLLKQLDAKPVDVIRFKEARAKELGISKKDERSVDAWVSLMVENPVLIERPIVVVGERAAIGRPPESVLGLLG